MSNLSRGEGKGVSGTPFFQSPQRGLALVFVFASLTFLLSLSLLTGGSGAEAAINLSSHASTTITAVVNGSPTISNTTTIDIVADALPDGFSGFELNVTLANAGVAEITAVVYNSNLAPTVAPTLPSDDVYLTGADINVLIGPGATNVVLATLTVQGTVKGTTAVNITIGATFGVQDEGGTTIASIATVSGSLVIANSVPVVNAGADQPSINEGDTVNLAPATFTDADPSEVHTASIDWGDSTVDIPTPGAGTVAGSHVYADNGVYIVTVTVNDGTGSGSDTLTVTVGNVNPVVNAGADQPGIVEGATVNLAPATFTDVGAGDTHTATIDWDDGSPLDNVGSVTGNVAGSHVYADNGTFTVTITVTDDDGGFGLDTIVVTVANAAPVVSAGPNQPGVVEGATVNLAPATFTDVGSGDTHTFTIDWDDGTIDGPTAAAGGNVPGSHAYADNGIYTVTVTVTDDDGGNDSDTLVVTVANAAPVVDAGPDQPGVVEGATVNLAPATFTDSGTGDTHTYTINWGDGTVEGPTAAAGGNVPGTHSYADNGVYIVTVTVTDDDLGLHADTLTVTVANSNPVVTPHADVTYKVGVNNLIEVATFTDAGVADTHTATVDWGDGTANNIVNPATSPISLFHIFTTAATTTPYIVTVTVTDDDGGSDVQTFNVTVGDFPSLPGGSGPARDLDGDGTAEDVNGSGLIDFNDVELLFWNIRHPSVLSNPSAFDFNGNGVIDFDDIVDLFILFLP